MNFFKIERPNLKKINLNNMKYFNFISLYNCKVHKSKLINLKLNKGNEI